MKKLMCVALFAGLATTFPFVGAASATDKPAEASAKKPAAEKSAAEKPAASGKVAVVNGTVITAEELEREIKSIMSRFAKIGQKITEEQLPDIRAGVLNKLVSELLLFQESQKQGVKIEPAFVEEQFAARKKQYPSAEVFQQMLKELGITEKIAMENFSRQLAVKKMVEEKIEKNINVGDDEVKGFYDKNRDTFFKQPERVRASHILVKVAPDAGEEAKSAARKKMEAAVERLNKGDDFAAVAKEVSEDTSASNGGDLNFFARGMMVKPFEDAAFGLKPGEKSGIVETQFGLHVIKVTEHKEESLVPFDEVKDKIKDRLFQEKVQKEVSGLVEELRKKGQVEIVNS